MSGRDSTPKRQLYRDLPFWAATPDISVAADKSPRAQAWDVIIIGTGISGALMAEALTRRRQSVLIVDRRQPVRGSTLASTAMIQHEIDIPLHQLIRQIGAARAIRAWQRSVRAVEDLQDLVRKLGIDCGMQRKQALYLTGDEMGHRAMSEERDARQAAGIPGQYLTRADLLSRFGIDRTAAILSEISASANPAQLTAGLLAVAGQRGAQIAAPLEISDIVEFRDGLALATRDGRVLRARQAVFCTGYEFLPVMQSSSHRITSTWALASRPNVARPAWLDDMLVWEAANPYLYFRTTADGRIIAGGEDRDDPTAYQDPDRLRIAAGRIAAKLEALCGIRMGDPAYVWSAPFGNTSDGLPIIDRVPGMRRAHAVMGFGGNGITFSMIAAQIVAARLRGARDPDEDLFALR